MKKILLATAATAAVFAATPAFAQAAPAAPAGARVELLVGYDRVKALGEHDGGVLFGIGAGYDFAVSPTVSIGADVEATGSTQEESVDGVSENAKRDLYAGGRATFAISDRANVYLKGGYTNARFRVSDGVDSIGGNFDGFRVGAGTQYRLAGKTYVGGEYRYSNYEAGLSRHQVALTLGTHF